MVSVLHRSLHHNSASKILYASLVPIVARMKEWSIILDSNGIYCCNNAT